MCGFVTERLGGEIVQQDKKFGRIKAGVAVRNLPNDFIVDAFLSGKGKVRERSLDMKIYIDFVIAREDGFYSDNRRPDSVTPCNIQRDLARRDFTMNAMAVNLETGILLDPFCGSTDIENNTITFVGNSIDRILEDFLRVIRAYRFKLTLTQPHNRVFTFNSATLATINNMEEVIARGLISVSNERMYDELLKMFMCDNKRAYELIGQMPKKIANVLLLENPGINLLPTMKEM
jgi:hypothetical protein